MKLNFCTLFNANYLSRGVLMYHSLQRHCKNFHLYVYAFDDKTYDYLSQANYPNLTVISLKQFEDPELLRIKPTRSAGEYCWTCSSSTILYSIEKYNLDNCTYIDADMCFYSDPKVLVDEMGDNSVLITEHRYTSSYDQSAISGKYCVQFVTFKNTPEGMKVLKWWRDACIDWCYGYVEDGKFGDQKYLDTWTRDFKGVHELKHLGGGLAPWNMQQYAFTKEGKTIQGKELSSGEIFEAVFFHFHGLKLFSNDMVSLTGENYEMNREAIDIFFRPYVKELMQVFEEIRKRDDSFNSNGANQPTDKEPMTFAQILKFFQYDVRMNPVNIFGSKTRSRLAHYHYYKVSDFINK